MSLKSSFAAFTGKVSYGILHGIFHRGSSFPGQIAYKIDPNVLKKLSKGYEVIIVTGTNGKTLTTSLITKVMRENYDDVLTNPTGSNMVQGITSAFLAHKRNPKAKKKIAVLEVDEANVAPICDAMTPSAFVLTNIFRDQMDRYGEIYTTYKKIVNGIKKAPRAKLIINADAAIFNSVDLPNPKVYYGFSDKGKENVDQRADFNVDGVLCPKCNHIMHYHMITYANLGSYFCPHCGFHRPTPNYEVTKLDELKQNYSKFELDGTPFKINIGGMYNIYNALAAYAIGRTFGTSIAQIKDAFSYDEQVFGRQEVINIKRHRATIVLVKNPVGLNQVIQTIQYDKEEYDVGFALNADYADGIDTSWIWDGNFEDLPYKKIPEIITGGKRYKDVTFRFEVAGAPKKKIVTKPDLDKFIDEIETLPTKKIYILATYTAMLQLRSKLMDRHYIK